MNTRLRFAVIGMNHSHIYAMTAAVIRGGGELVFFYAAEVALLADFALKFPGTKVARSIDEILQDTSIKLVLSAMTPVDRAALAIRVMEHGKDFLSDKPGITSLEQLRNVREVQQKTQRIYSVMFSERFENPATVKAGQLVAAGAIGKVIQTIGIGPHKNTKTPLTREPWFFDRKYYGGILTDIASHQFDQFLFFTGSTRAEIIASQVANVNHHQYPAFEDFGDVMVQGDNGCGYIRVDWFSPGGLNSWGDGRLTILGTEGYIELRKYIDIAGRSDGNHLFLVDKKETRYINGTNVELPFGRLLVDDVLNRTETAMTQAHCFLSTELALLAQAKANDVSNSF